MTSLQQHIQISCVHLKKKDINYLLVTFVKCLDTEIRGICTRGKIVKAPKGLLMLRDTSDLFGKGQRPEPPEPTPLHVSDPQAHTCVQINISLGWLER